MQEVRKTISKMIFSALPKIGLNIVTKRFIRKKVILKSWPNDWVPFHWTRPVKEIGYYNSGDLVDLNEPEEEDLQNDARMSRELKSLDTDDPLRKMFSLSHARRSRHNKAFVKEHLEKLGLIHEVDYSNSLEAKIISLTFSLRQLQEAVRTKGEDNRFNAHTRRAANSCKYRRNRYLNELREMHLERYNRMVEALDIEHTEVRFNVELEPLYRKVQMRRLALEYARDLKEKKVEEFMQSIEKEKLDFQKYKEDTLKWIEEAEKELRSLEVSH